CLVPIRNFQAPQKVWLPPPPPFEGDARRQIFQQTETLARKVPYDPCHCGHERMPQQVHRNTSLGSVVSPISGMRAYEQHSGDECPIRRKSGHEATDAMPNNYSLSTRKTLAEPVYDCSTI